MKLESSKHSYSQTLSLREGSKTVREEEEEKERERKEEKRKLGNRCCSLTSSRCAGCIRSAVSTFMTKLYFFRRDEQLPEIVPADLMCWSELCEEYVPHRGRKSLSL